MYVLEKHEYYHHHQAMFSCHLNNRCSHVSGPIIFLSVVVYITHTLHCRQWRALIRNFERQDFPFAPEFGSDHNEPVM